MLPKLALEGQNATKNQPRHATCSRLSEQKFTPRHGSSESCEKAANPGSRKLLSVTLLAELETLGHGLVSIVILMRRLDQVCFCILVLKA